MILLVTVTSVNTLLMSSFSEMLILSLIGSNMKLYILVPLETQRLRKHVTVFTSADLTDFMTEGRFVLRLLMCECLSYRELTEVQTCLKQHQLFWTSNITPVCSTVLSPRWNEWILSYLWCKPYTYALYYSLLVFSFKQWKRLQVVLVKD